MNCMEAKAHLPTLADGELHGEAHELVAAHVAQCPACAEEVRRWKDLRKAVRRVMLAETVPADLGARVAAALASRELARRRRRLLIGSGIGLSAAAVLLVSVWLHGVATRQPQKPADVLVRGVAIKETHLACTVNSTHDYFDSAGKTVSEANPLVAQHYAKAGMKLPDLGSDGFGFDAACCCYSGSTAAQALHASYHGAQDPAALLSFFQFDRKVKLDDADETLTGRSGRQYHICNLAGGFTVLHWNTESFGFALCAKQSDRALEALADAIDVATLRNHPGDLAMISIPGFVAAGR